MLQAPVHTSVITFFKQQTQAVKMISCYGIVFADKNTSVNLQLLRVYHLDIKTGAG